MEINGESRIVLQEDCILCKNVTTSLRRLSLLNILRRLDYLNENFLKKTENRTKKPIMKSERETIIHFLNLQFASPKFPEFVMSFSGMFFSINVKIKL